MPFSFTHHPGFPGVEMSHQPERALTHDFAYTGRPPCAAVEMSHQPERALTLIRGIFGI